jgi:hypothetical protein
MGTLRLIAFTSTIILYAIAIAAIVAVIVDCRRDIRRFK